MNSTGHGGGKKTAHQLKNFFIKGQRMQEEVLLVGSCLWDHFTVGILPDDTASILPSFKDITLICGIVEVILSPPLLAVFSGQ